MTRIICLETIVVDEIHSVSDPQRGYLLELLLTKLEFMSRKDGEDVDVQIIGMSATLPNLPLLAAWLNARLYVTDFRPVPLTEFLFHGKVFKNKDMVETRELGKEFLMDSDTSHVTGLVLTSISWKQKSLSFGQ